MTKTHLFGEMDLDLTQTAQDVFNKAYHISEMCGYITEAFDDHIDIRGEDCDDAFYVINRLHIDNKKIVGVTKRVYLYDDNKLLKIKVVSL